MLLYCFCYRIINKCCQTEIFLVNMQLVSGSYSTQHYLEIIQKLYQELESNSTMYCICFSTLVSLFLLFLPFCQMHGLVKCLNYQFPLSFSFRTRAQFALISLTSLRYTPSLKERKTTFLKWRFLIWVIQAAAQGDISSRTARVPS